MELVSRSARTCRFSAVTALQAMKVAQIMRYTVVSSAQDGFRCGRNSRTKIV
jgi:hypothetical protein